MVLNDTCLPGGPVGMVPKDTCLPGGPVVIAPNGVAIINIYSSSNTEAVLTQVIHISTYNCIISIWYKLSWFLVLPTSMPL